MNSCASKSVALIAILTLSACSVFRPIGQENFDCNGKNSTSPYCKSFKGIDASTRGNIPDTKYDKAFNYTDYDKYMGSYVDTEGKPTQEAESYAKAGVLPHEMIGGATDAPVAGAPVRTAPVIQKIWINRYVDAQDKLHQPVEVYQEVIGSHWSGVKPSRLSTAQQENRYPHLAANADRSAKADTDAPDIVAAADGDRSSGPPLPEITSQKEALGNPQ